MSEDRSNLKGLNILLGVSAGIAAYKSVELASRTGRSAQMSTAPKGRLWMKLLSRLLTSSNADQPQQAGTKEPDSRRQWDSAYGEHGQAITTT